MQPVWLYMHWQMCFEDTYERHTGEKSGPAGNSNILPPLSKPQTKLLIAKAQERKCRLMIPMLERAKLFWLIWLGTKRNNQIWSKNATWVENATGGKETGYSVINYDRGLIWPRQARLIMRQHAGLVATPIHSQWAKKYQNTKKIPKSTTKKTKSGDVNPQSQKNENCDTSLSHSKNHIMGFGPSENEQGRHRHGVW